MTDREIEDRKIIDQETIDFLRRCQNDKIKVTCGVKAYEYFKRFADENNINVELIEYIPENESNENMIEYDFKEANS